MANELRHSDVGTALSKSEWEAVGGHIFNSQAAGDIMYASTTSQLSRLGIGSANQVLAVNSGATAPEWVTSVASATLAATVTVVDSTDTSSYIAMFDSATGSLAAKTDAGLTYNAGTGMLTATGFTGPLTGTLVTAAQGNVTSLGTLTTLTVDNVIINGTTIGHTSDTDLMTLTDGVLTVAGEVDATSLDVSGSADIDGTMEADAYTVDGTALNEYIADTVGAMVGSNTETRIAVTYDDADNTLDFVVDDMTASGSTTFVLEDDDGTEVTVANSKEVKFIGSGLTTNWTDVDNGTDADPYDLTFTVDAAQTGITSVLNASLVVGRDADNDIDFSTDNNIRFRAGAEDQLTLTDGYLTPSSNGIVDLGTDALEFNNAFFDGTVEADAITIGGTNIVTGSLITTLGTVSAGTWQGTAIASSYIAADAITGAKIADDAIDSEHYADGSIDNAHIADDAIDSEHYAAGSIDTAHIADNQITLAKMAGLARGKIIYGDSSGDPAALAVGTADQVLTHDGTDVSWADAGGGGLEEYDIWSLSSNDSDTDNVALDTNLIRWDPSIGSEDAFDKIGTGMSKSSGNFTFPSTGKWEIFAQAAFSGMSQIDGVACYIYHTRNSTQSSVAHGWAHRHYSNMAIAQAGPVMLDITDTADTIQFRILSAEAYDGNLLGDDKELRTYLVFKKVGDT